jgi:hypothetical protein
MIIQRNILAYIEAGTELVRVSQLQGVADSNRKLTAIFYFTES